MINLPRNPGKETLPLLKKEKEKKKARLLDLKNRKYLEPLMVALIAWCSQLDPLH